MLTAFFISKNKLTFTLMDRRIGKEKFGNNTVYLLRPIMLLLNMNIHRNNKLSR